MNLTKAFPILMTVTALGAVSGCGFKDEKNPSSGSPTTTTTTPTNPTGGGNQTGGGTGTTTSAATFSQVTSQVLQPNCFSCHGNGSASGGVDLSSYNGVMAVVSAGNPSGSQIYTAISSGAMPPGGSLSQADIDLVNSWIQNGAQDN